MVTRHGNGADRQAFAHQRHRGDFAIAEGAPGLRASRRGVRGLGVLDTNDLTIQYRAPGRTVAVERNRVHALYSRFVYQPIVRQRHCLQVKLVADHEFQPESLVRKQALRALHDGVEHRLIGGRRTADHAQHFSRGGLLLERFLGLVDQAHVLDGDHGLVGEGLQ